MSKVTSCHPSFLHRTLNLDCDLARVISAVSYSILLFIDELMDTVRWGGGWVMLDCWPPFPKPMSQRSDKFCGSKCCTRTSRWWWSIGVVDHIAALPQLSCSAAVLFGLIRHVHRSCLYQRLIHCQCLTLWAKGCKGSWYCHLIQVKRNLHLATALNRRWLIIDSQKTWVSQKPGRSQQYWDIGTPPPKKKKSNVSWKLSGGSPKNRYLESQGHL